MLNHSSFLDFRITEASIGKPDPKFWIELEKVIDEIKNSLTDGSTEEQRLYFSQEIAQLESLLEIGGKGNNLRRLQRDALEAIITMLRRGESEGYIKLPTGVGKTILFALIISAIKQPTLIMVPGKDLIEQTKETFEDGFGYAPGEVKGLLLENGTASEELENFLNEIEGIERNGVVICTNDSLKSIYRTNPELLQRLYNRIQVLVTDEAHKALGEVHREMMDEGLSGEVNKLHLLFTATPELSKKHVNEHYRPVFEATLQEAVNDGILVLPNHVGPEIAYLNVSSDAITSPTQEFLDAHSLKFLDENRRPIYESLTDEYLRIKQNSPHGYAPALAVCATISQVDTIVTYLESRGLRAGKVVSDKDTSGIENLDAIHAKELINTDQLDVIVTVKKVAEGWDVPTLRNIIRYYPTLSPAQLVQSFGRVIRQVEWKHIEEMVRMMHERGIHTDLSLNEVVHMLLKTRENTNLIEPAQWQMRRSNFERREDDDDDDGDDGDNVEGGDGPAGGDTPGSEEDDEVFFTLSHTIQALVNKNELSADEARGFYPSIEIEDNIELPELGEDGKVEIDGKIYQRVGANTPFDQLWGVDGGMADKRVKNQLQEWKDENVKQAKTKYGRVVYVIEMKALKVLLEEDIEMSKLGEDGKVEIDGKIYQRVGANTPSDQLWGVDGGMADRRVKNQSQEWKDENVKRAKSITGSVQVVELETLKKLLKEDIEMSKLGEDGKVEIDEKTYQRVGYKTPSDQLWGVTGQTANRRVKNQSQEWKDENVKRAKSITGSVQVVELETLKKLLKEDIEMSKLGEDGKVEIDGKIYQRVGSNTPSEQLWGVSGQVANRRIEAQSQKWKDKNVKKVTMKDGRLVNSIEIKILKELLKDDIESPKLGANGKVEIDGKTYQRVGYNTPENQLWGINGKKICRRIKNKSEDWQKLNIKKAKGYGEYKGLVNVIELLALKELLGIKE